MAAKVDYRALKEAIKAQHPLRKVVEVLGGVELRGGGRNLKGLCPFHDDNTPSLTVSVDKQLYHCFTCKTGGDVLAFVQQLRGIDFIDALELLAEFLEINIQDHSRPLTPQEEQEEAYYAVLHQTAETYQHILLETPSALKYLTEHRGLTAETIAQFKLGYAPHPSAEGPWVDQLDLTRPDMWTDAIVIPLFDIRGRVAGFQTRPISGHPQKYIHQQRTSPSWGLRSPLFGWHIARKHFDEKQVIIVEGALDVIAMHQAGFDNTVGLLGSELRDAQMQRIQTVAFDDVILMLDGDTAGVQGAAKIAANCVTERPQWPLRIATIPSSDDPEDYLKQEGAQGIRHLLGHATPFFLHRMDMLWQELRPQNLTETLQYFGQCGPTLERLAPLQRPIAIAWLAERAQVPLYDVWDLWYERKLSHDYHSRQDEERVLAYGLQPGHLAIVATDRRLQGTFYIPTHIAIYDALHLCHQQQLVPTPQLMQQLSHNVATVAHVQSLVNLATREVINYQYHRDQVVAHAARRHAHEQLNLALQRLDDGETDPDALLHNTAITLLEGQQGHHQDDAVTAIAQVNEATEIIVADAQRTGMLGYSLGEHFPVINAVIDGLQPGRTMGLMSMTNVGKSTLAANFTASLLDEIPVLWLSVEEQRVDILTRIWAAMSGAAIRNIRRGQTTPQETERVIDAIRRYTQSGSLVHSIAGWPFADIMCFIREKAQTDGVGLFILDYIQRVPMTGMDVTDRYGSYGQMSMSLCNLSVELQIAGIVVAQLHRVARNCIVPTAEDVGDSYRIVQDLDVVLTMAQKSQEMQQKDGLERGNRLLYVAKNRCGPRDIIVDLAMHPMTLVMQELGYSQLSANRPVPPAVSR